MSDKFPARKTRFYNHIRSPAPAPKLARSLFFIPPNNRATVHGKVSRNLAPKHSKGGPIMASAIQILRNGGDGYDLLQRELDHAVNRLFGNAPNASLAP